MKAVKASILHLLLQIADIITTIVAVVIIGMQEINPISKCLLDHNVTLFALIKIALSVAIILGAAAGKVSAKALWIVNIFYMLVITSNIGHLIYAYTYRLF